MAAVGGFTFGRFPGRESEEGAVNAWKLPGSNVSANGLVVAGRALTIIIIVTILVIFARHAMQ